MTEKKQRRAILKEYAVLLTLATIGFFVRLWRFPEFSMDLHLKVMGYSIIFFALAWEFFSFVNRFLNKHYPFEKSIPGRMILQLVIGVSFMLLVRVYLDTTGTIDFPIKFDKFFILSTYLLSVLISVLINFGFFTVYFVDRWKESIVKAERLEKEKSQVQFDNLKNQLNPHFLFNALTSLNSLIFENQELASRFLQDLSKVYRYVLQHKDKNHVSLQTELTFIDNYISLLQIRFEEALKINIAIPDKVKDNAIVPATLQILIENALKHNIVDKNKPLTIDIIAIGDYLVVSNNLQQKKNVETSNKQGLENLRSLYRFLTERPVIIEVNDSRFYAKVPLV